ncbi:MAG: RNA polymerase sporulation sigma factor SigK [Christensenellales bacterium]
MIIENFITFMNKIMLFSSYVNKVSGFPKQLPPEEEKRLLNEFHNGSIEAKNKLIEHNLRLVAHIVKKYTSSGEAEDLISAGSIGLIKAINTYNNDKNTQLSTYAARCIENEILMLLRANKKHNQTISINESLGNDKDGNEILLGDIIPNIEDDAIEEVENNIINKELYKVLKNTLSEREYKIICLRYGLNGNEPLTQREIASKLNISRSYISRLETKALQELRKKKDLLF